MAEPKPVAVTEQIIRHARSCIYQRTGYMLNNERAREQIIMCALMWGDGEHEVVCGRRELMQEVSAFENGGSDAFHVKIEKFLLYIHLGKKRITDETLCELVERVRNMTEPIKDYAGNQVPAQ